MSSRINPPKGCGSSDDRVRCPRGVWPHLIYYVQMNRIRFYVNGQKPEASAVRADLVGAARRAGLSVIEDGVPDVLLVLGGDGTILRAVREFPETPVLGLNLGGLGFLSSVERQDFEQAMDRLARGAFSVSERTGLAVSRDGASFTALNDVVINREMSGHAAILDLEIDGRRATRYMADGLIIATPTGSTAYSLAAGGPILTPDAHSFVITPMSPHSLGARPLVVNDTVRLAVISRQRANGDADRLDVFADGAHVLTLDGDEPLEIVRAARGARLVELAGYDPYDVLARKLGWSGTSSGYAKGESK